MAETGRGLGASNSDGWTGSGNQAAPNTAASPGERQATRNHQEIAFRD